MEPAGVSRPCTWQMRPCSSAHGGGRGGVCRVPVFSAVAAVQSCSGCRHFASVRKYAYEKLDRKSRCLLCGACRTHFSLLNAWTHGC